MLIAYITHEYNIQNNTKNNNTKQYKNTQYPPLPAGCLISRVENGIKDYIFIVQFHFWIRLVRPNFLAYTNGPKPTPNFIFILPHSVWFHSPISFTRNLPFFNFIWNFNFIFSSPYYMCIEHALAASRNILISPIKINPTSWTWERKNISIFCQFGKFYQLA